MLPSTTHPESGKNPPDLAGPVPWKLQHKTFGRNVLPQTLLCQTWQQFLLRCATCHTHPSNFAGAAVWEENNILQATDMLRELSANLRKQVQTSRIDQAKMGEKLGVVPIQEQLDELESEKCGTGVT